ncbi:MAG: glycosyltransferase [Candidatus Eisenbacteria bacterium]|nr:glycosyltransferase [Candidatus Eisenbacteria bacterium]
MARVTVVLPTFNKRDDVAEALESVLTQTYEERDVVIVDDGSTDGTPVYLFSRFGAQPHARKIVAGMNPAALRPFSHAFPSHGSTIIYHYQPNRGLSAARNRGILETRGQLLAFLEAEDVWDLRHLETHMRFRQEHPAALVTCVGECPAGGNGRGTRGAKLRQISGEGWIFEQTLTSSPLCTSAVMLQRSVVEKCGLFDENLEACEDYDFWLRISARYPVYGLEGAPILRRSLRRKPSARAWSAEKFRVYALEKSFQSGHLDGRQRLLVAEEVVRKCERLVDGYRRTRSEERANFYERKRKRYSLEVRKLRASQVAQVQG